MYIKKGQLSLIKSVFSFIMESVFYYSSSLGGYRVFLSDLLRVYQRHESGENLKSHKNVLTTNTG